MNSKYSNFLTVLLILIIVAIVGIIGFLGFKYYKTQVTKNEGEEFVDSFNNQNTNINNNINNNTSIIPPDEEVSFEGVDEGNSGNSGSNENSSNKQQTYQGYTLYGTIEIPVTKLKSPIIEYNATSIDIGVGLLYPINGPLNEAGVTVLSSHNKRNGALFANNKKLNVGDKIFITDLSGKRLSYTIYDKYETTPEDAEYITKDTQGGIEIALSTCTDDSKARLIILAKADV